MRRPPRQGAGRGRAPPAMRVCRAWLPPASLSSRSPAPRRSRLGRPGPGRRRSVAPGRRLGAPARRGGLVPRPALRAVELRGRTHRAARRAPRARAPRRATPAPFESLDDPLSSACACSNVSSASLIRLHPRRGRTHSPRGRDARPARRRRRRDDLGVRPNTSRTLVPMFSVVTTHGVYLRSIRAPPACARPRAGARLSACAHARHALPALQDEPRRDPQRRGPFQALRVPLDVRRACERFARSSSPDNSELGDDELLATVGVDAHVGGDAERRNPARARRPRRSAPGRPRSRTSRLSPNASRSLAAAAARQHDDVDARLLTEPRNAATIPSAARGPCTYVRRRHVRRGRLWIVVSTSRFAAASLPVTSPIRRGRSERTLARRGEEPFACELRLRRSSAAVRADAETLDRQRLQSEVALRVEPGRP